MASPHSAKISEIDKRRFLENINRSLRNEAVEPVASQRSFEDHSVIVKDSLHDFRNRLTAICLKLHLFKKEMENGMQEEADTTFEKLLDQIENLSASIEWQQLDQEPFPVSPSLS